MFISLAILLLYSLALIVVIYSDLKYRIISNKLVGVVATISLIYTIDNSQVEQLAYVPVGLFIGLVLWKLNIFAGGDVKLFVVILPSINSMFYKEIFVLIAFVWGGVALIVYLRKKFFVESALSTVPFGVPLAIGSWVGVIASLS